MAGVAGGVEQVAARMAVAAAKTGILASLVDARGDGQGNGSGPSGYLLQIGLQVEYLLGREFLGGVALVTYDADDGGGGDIGIGVHVFGIFAPPIVAPRGIVEAVARADEAVGRALFVKIGVAVDASQAVAAQRRGMEEATADGGRTLQRVLGERFERAQKEQCENSKD